MRHIIGVATALALMAGQASAQDQTRPDRLQVAQVTYSFCTNYDGNTYIVPSGQQRQFQHCNNFFYSLQSAVGGRPSLLQLRQSHQRLAAGRRLLLRHHLHLPVTRQPATGTDASPIKEAS